MSVTTLNLSTRKTTLKFHEGLCKVQFYDASGLLSIDNISESDITLKFKSYVSDNPKVFVRLSSSPYHFLHDQLGSLLAAYKLAPKALFLIDVSTLDNHDLPTYIKWALHTLDLLGANYELLDATSETTAYANDLYFVDSNDFELNNPVENIRGVVNAVYAPQRRTSIGRKVFLSRKNYQGRDLRAYTRGTLPYENDNRIDDETLLVDYFKRLGYEIICPEDFSTFEEQVQFFQETSTLVSTTSSGLTNQIFMDEGSTVIEIVTPLISFTKEPSGPFDMPHGQEELHHFYHLLAFDCGHFYMSVQNPNRKATEVIAQLEANKKFIQALSER